MTKEDIKKSVIEWNVRFPIDRWWREKHKIAFGSLAHRDSSFLDQLREFYEDEIFNDLSRQEENEYIPNIGDWIKRDNKEVVSIEDLREEFKDIINKESDKNK